MRMRKIGKLRQRVLCVCVLVIVVLVRFEIESVDECLLKWIYLLGWDEVGVGKFSVVGGIVELFVEWYVGGKFVDGRNVLVG